MTRPGLLDRQGLLTWADTIGARSELPRLIRRLILETGHGIAQLRFPGGEGISSEGWDGTVYANTARLYVPEGLSLWELSVDKSPGTKADLDYAKRTTTPDGSPTGDCTYVAVSLRPWTKRAEWARKCSADGRWKDVRALGVDDVETWLESGPVTHAWLSEQAGLDPHGLVTAQRWWDTWSSATAPTFPATVVAAGRNDTVTALRAALDRPGRIVTIHGSSLDEILAFVATVGVLEEPSDRRALLTRTVLIDKVETWRRLRAHPTPLLLIARTDDVTAELAAGTPHVLIVPCTGTTGADVELPPIDSLLAAEVLEAEGVSEQTAREIGKLARLSLLAARRRLAHKPELHEPIWAQTPASKTVRRSVLIGRWHESSKADCDLVENAMGIPYVTLREEATALCAGDDPLLARLGGTVGVVSHLDAWLLLRRELRKDDLEAFHEAARMVFAENDPSLELPQGGRWGAALFGKKRSYSRDLRHGLATTLALLGSHGQRAPSGDNITGFEWAGQIVREVLEAANADVACHLWVSLADVLPLFAESAPTEFLEAVRVGVTGDTPVLRGIFSDTNVGGDALWPDSAHPSILWALETSAWSPDHFGLVLDLLARLAEIDPGGRLLNRPSASLTTILLPWWPQNSVSVDRRLAAIDRLRDRYPPVAWKLLLSLLPGVHRVSNRVSEPRYRDWKPEIIDVTPKEYQSYVEGICSRVLSDVNGGLDRWKALIEKIDHLLASSRSAALRRLDELSRGDDVSTVHYSAIWQALRSQAARHRRFPNADWALPEDEVAAIEAVAARFEPTEPTERYGWLFEQQMPELPDIGRGNFAEYEAKLDRKRSEAASEMADSNDWSSLRDFALSTEYPGIFGAALANATRDEYETILLRLLDSADEKDVGFAAGYFSQRFRSERWTWLEPYLADRDPSPAQAARLLLCTHDYPKAWELAEEMGEAASFFWRHFRTVGLGGDFSHLDLAAERLLDAGRPGGALDLIGLYSGREQEMSPARAALVAGALEALLERDPGDSEVKLLSQCDLAELFDALDRSKLDRERLARLEWAYLYTLGHSYRLVALNHILSEDPSFFVDVIRRVCRPQKDDAFVRKAYLLLSQWKRIPGQRDDASIDTQMLEAWVAEARQKLRESGHLERGDSYLGHLFARAPIDADGSRVCLAVRNLLEKLQSPAIENGLLAELCNSRGVTTRGLYDGGNQERDLARHYSEHADRFSERWPLTAMIFRRLAASYERDARRYDDDAERLRNGFDT